MTAKPTLGFATRTEAVLALRAGGKTTRQIADAIGIEPQTVSALEVSALRSAARLRNAAQAFDGRAVLLPTDILSRMRRASAKRGMEPHELAIRIIRTVVMENMIDAVIDDEVAD